MSVNPQTSGRTKDNTRNSPAGVHEKKNNTNKHRLGQVISRPKGCSRFSDRQERSILGNHPFRFQIRDRRSVLSVSSCPLVGLVLLPSFLLDQWMHKVINFFPMKDWSAGYRGHSVEVTPFDPASVIRVYQMGSRPDAKLGWVVRKRNLPYWGLATILTSPVVTRWLKGLRSPWPMWHEYSPSPLESTTPNRNHDEPFAAGSGHQQAYNHPSQGPW